MDKLEQEILKLAAERGLIDPDELKIPSLKNPLNYFVEQGKISIANLESLRSEILGQMNTLADPSWLPIKSSIEDQSDKISIAVFGRFIQLQLIGQGGMAHVYKAYDPTLGRPVALKLFYQESERLLMEARNQARVEHESVCKVFEVGEVSGKQYICMQYLQGKTLSQVSNEMNLKEKIEVIQKIADAVYAAHRNGLVHRDIKPTNIMLERSESGLWKPYILDFGLARMQAAPGITQQGVIIGTPYYMPPEQARGGHIDTRSDVYSLGATLYELIAGRPPFIGTTPEVLLQVLQKEVIPIQMISPQISADLRTIVMKCLDKDPATRYGSAKALAEDLKHYLDGEPILARPVSLPTRVWKKTKKNRLAALIFASAIVTTALLLSLLIFTRWKASVQTQYEKEFGEEIRYIDAMLLSTYTAPLHDVRPNLNVARQRLLRIEQRIKNGGKWAYGPGNNALGHGYLMLKEYERAEEFLENAWKSGYQNPSTAYALGKIKGILWRQAVIDSDTLMSHSLQEEAKRKADQEYRRPAIQFLKNAREFAESPAYVEALIFLYERRHNEAFEKSRKALTISSRPYEVWKLQGDIHFEIGQAEINRKAYDSALKSFHSAGEAYSRAAEIGRSDQDIYLADAERWTRTAYTQDWGNEQFIALEKAIEACDKAALVQPDNERSYFNKSGVYLQKGINQLYTTGNPKPAFLQAVSLARQAASRNKNLAEAHNRAAIALIRLAEYETTNSMDPRKSLQESNEESQKALKLNARNSAAYTNLASAHFYLGEYELSHGGNPLPSLQKVIDIFQSNLRTLPRDEYSFNLLGLAYLDMGDYRFKHGEDPRPDFNHSIESYQSALKLRSEAYVVFANMGLVYVNLAKYEMTSGIDPAKSIEQSIKKYDQCISLKSDYPYAYHDRGSAFLLKAEHKLRLGEDPTSDLTTAMSSYKKSLELNSELTFPHLNIGNTYFLYGSHAFNSKKNPAQHLNASREAIEGYLKKDASFYEAYRIRAATELLGARWSILNRRAPESSFDHAIKDLKKGIQLNKNEIAIFRDLASVYRYKAEWNLSQKEDARESISNGYEAIHRALNLSSLDPEAVAIHGSLKLLEATQSHDSSIRTNRAKEALNLLNQALAANHFLKREYEHLRTQATNFN